MKRLIIVESPTKARTLKRFLGSDYQIEASYGHIRDLPSKKLGIDIDNNFTLLYQVLPEKTKIVNQLVKQAKQANEVILATDPDREGEAIAYHIRYLLKQKKLTQPIKRITFHEITKSAIEEALKHPGEINQDLFDAQQARRALDRLVGYKLSPLLWRKVRRGLSAGRVQSVVVRLICEREAQRQSFKPEEYWQVKADFKRQDIALTEYQLIKLRGKKAQIHSANQVKQLTDRLNKARYQVVTVELKQISRRPKPPLITSTLQQLAANKYGFSAYRTMRAAQSLYEKGLITYHRTDSVKLSTQAIKAIRRYIASCHGDAYLPEKPRAFKTKSQLAQEAHEAIRPTKIDLTPEDESLTNSLSRDEKRIYDLIWRRSLMSQMSDWQGQQATVEIESQDDTQARFRRQAISETFSGWKKLVWKEDKEDQISYLDRIKVGDAVTLVKLDWEQKFTQPPPRYGDASLIKLLEEKGIGRPSTYAPILQKIQQRGYVEKEERRFLPTPLGWAVNEFLIHHFPDIMDYDFTAKMEADLDKIALGQLNWRQLVTDFWKWFGPKVEQVTKKAERVKVKAESTGETCPKCGQGEVLIRVGRYGKFKACSRYPECDYTAEYIQTTNYQCPDCQDPVVIRKTRKGRKFYGCSRYPKCQWRSWRKPK